MPPPSYPFDEFTKHFVEIYPTLRVNVGDKFSASLNRLIDHMNDRYPAEEALFKTQRFFLCMNCLSTHFRQFDQFDYAVYGSEETGSLVSDHLFRAVHHWYVEKFIDEPRDPKPREIMALADNYRAKAK